MEIFPILLISGWTLLTSLLAYAGATALIIRTFVGFIPRGRDDLGFWKSVAVMMIVTFEQNAEPVLPPFRECRNDAPRLPA
jgi:hypothetical protein